MVSTNARPVTEADYLLMCNKTSRKELIEWSEYFRSECLVPAWTSRFCEKAIFPSDWAPSTHSVNFCLNPLRILGASDRSTKTKTKASTSGLSTHLGQTVVGWTPQLPSCLRPKPVISVYPSAHSSCPSILSMPSEKFLSKFCIQIWSLTGVCTHNPAKPW